MHVRVILSITSAITLSLFLSGCVPVLVGGAAVTTGMFATQDRSVTSTLSDSQLSTQIIAKIYKYNKHLQSRVGVTVHGGEVLLTGTVDNTDEQVKLEEIAWAEPEVVAVQNYIEVSEERAIRSYPSDSVITTSIKTKLLFGGDIKSGNISVKTVRGVAYIMGIVRSQEEQDKIIDIARNTAKVKKVVSLLRLKPFEKKIEPACKDESTPHEKPSQGADETEEAKEEAAQA